MTGGRFFEQFIEDYYAECDEHLAVTRRALLAIEQDRARVPAPRVLQELFRSLHTLKGLSGMVGLHGAERVAHAMEGALKTMQREQRPMDQPVVDALFVGVGLLERCVASKRANGSSPPVDSYLLDLAAAVPGATGHAAEDRRGEQTTASEDAASRESGAAPALTYRFEFAPSRELSERGIGVEGIRARLQTLGTIVSARPHVVNGGVIFEFEVAVPLGAAPDPAWEADGLRWSSLVTEVAEETSLDESTGADDSAPVGLAAGASVVRVDLARIDEVMRLVGELVNTRGRLADLLAPASATAAGTWDALQEVNAAMERQLRTLREGIMRIRLVPVGEVFERLRFAMRDLARESGKRLEIELRGQETAIDKLVVDRMLEPLLHLVRNAVSHGIETPEERLARGKPEEGRLALRAAASGERIVIEVEDDGAGIDVERVAARARARGIHLSEGMPDVGDLLDVLCLPGFSMRDEADMTSGRGVGMDVVRSTVRSLGGELTLDTKLGQGTRFTIQLPLTLMIVDALLVEVGGQQMAVPQPVLREVMRVEAAVVTGFERNDVMPYRGGVLPLLSLRRLFNLPDDRRQALHVLVVGTETSPSGLVVDRLLGLREIVVHPVNDPLVAVQGVNGATELGDGRVSLVLDAAALVRLAQERREQRPAAVA